MFVLLMKLLENESFLIDNYLYVELPLFSVICFLRLLLYDLLIILWDTEMRFGASIVSNKPHFLNAAIKHSLKNMFLYFNTNPNINIQKLQYYTYY